MIMGIIMIIYYKDNYYHLDQVSPVLQLCLLRNTGDCVDTEILHGFLLQLDFALRWSNRQDEQNEIWSNKGCGSFCCDAARERSYVGKQWQNPVIVRLVPPAVRLAPVWASPPPRAAAAAVWLWWRPADCRPLPVGGPAPLCIAPCRPVSSASTAHWPGSPAAQETVVVSEVAKFSFQL